MSSAFESVSGSVYGVRSIPSSITSSPHSAPPLPSPPTSPHLQGFSPPGSPSSLGSFPSALSAMGSILSLDDVNIGRGEGDLVAFSSQEHPESGHHLVIPSLALGPSLVPTLPPPEAEIAYGEAIGNVRIFVLGGQRSIADNLLMRSPQVVHIHGWDHPSGDVTACLEASTILADRERNVRLTVMPSFDIRDNESTKRAVNQVLQTLRASFQTLHQQLHPARAPGPDFTAMLASHRTPLVTAVVLVVSDPITAKEHDIISSISSHAPVITLPPPNRRRHHPSTRPPTQPQSQSQTRAHSRSNSQGGLADSQFLAPPLNRHSTQRPHGHDRGRSTLRRISHASPPFAPAPYSSASPPVAPYHSASPPFAPIYPPISATASPPFPPPREYVFHLNGMSELAHVLFHNPRALAALRDAAAARFIAWREREHNPLSPIPQSAAEEKEEADSQEKKPVVGLFGFEDPEAGSDLDLAASDLEQYDSEGGDDEAMIMRTMWKLGGYNQRESSGATLKPSTTREPLPSFTAPESLAGASPPPAPAPVRRSKEFGASTIRGGKGTALERSVYHDPLHVPSLVALAVSVLPQMLGRVFGLRSSASTRRLGKAPGKAGENGDGEGKGWSGLTVLLSMGAACAATFCAGWVCGFWMA